MVIKSQNHENEAIFIFSVHNHYKWGIGAAENRLRGKVEPDDRDSRQQRQQQMRHDFLFHVPGRFSVFHVFRSIFTRVLR